MSQENSRREFIKKAVYVAPVILSLQVQPSYAGGGSAGCERGHHVKKHHNHHKSRGSHPKPGNSQNHMARNKGPGFIQRMMGGNL